MSILADHEIRAYALRHQMIEPFIEGQQSEGVISSGLSSYGYDATLDPTTLLLFKSGDGGVIDPKNFDRGGLYNCPLTEDGAWIIPPHGFALGCTKEYFRIPRDVLALCMGKSTYARCGLIVNVTPLEPEWEGQVTLELHNTTGRAIKIYPDEGICQFVFSRGGEFPSVSYADRKGKYMGQQGITLPRIKSPKEPS